MKVYAILMISVITSPVILASFIAFILVHAAEMGWNMGKDLTEFLSNRPKKS